MIRASMRTSEKVNSWPIPLRYFWTQLWGYCDSYGRGLRDARLVYAGTLPLDEEVNANVVNRWMEALEIAGVIVLYWVDSKQYFECLNWDEHQQIKYRKKTTIPDRLGAIPGSAQSSEKFSNVSHQVEGEGEVEGEVEGEGESAPAPAPFCIKHPKGTDTPCRACGNARKMFEAAALEKKSRPTSRPPTAAEIAATMCSEHPHYPLPCGLCAELAVKAVA